MANKQIRQEITLTNVTADPVDSVEALYGGGGIVRVDPNDFNGATAFFEVVAKNSDSSPRNMVLEDRSDPLRGGTGTVVVSILANTNSWKIFRSSDFVLSGTDIYKYYSAAVFDDVLSIKSARIIILQDAADITDTQTQIEVGAYESWADVASAETYYPLVEPKYWKYEASKWDPTPTFTFGFTAINENDMDFSRVALQESADAAFTSPATVANSVVSFDLDSAVAYYESDPFIPKDGYYYRVAYTSDGTMYGGTIYNAKVIAGQPGLADEAATDAGGTSIADGQGQSFQSPSSAQYLVKAAFLLTEFGTSSGTAKAVLYDHSGAYGTSSVPTGEALATSETIDLTFLTGGGGTDKIWVYFKFTTPYQMLASTYYVITIEPVSTIDDVHHVLLGDHSGNGCYKSGGWIAIASDRGFRIYIGLSDGTITKLQTEYLLINEAQTDTGLQEFQTQWDPAEWNDGADGLPTCFHEHSADDAGSNTKLQDEDTSDLANSDIAGEDLIRSYYARSYGNLSGHRIYGGSGTQEELGQSFQVDVAATIKTIRLNLRQTLSPIDNLYLRVGTTNGGSEIGLSDAVDITDLTSPAEWVDFNFSTKLSLSISTIYYMTLYRSGSRDVNNSADWSGSNSNIYPDGIAYTKNSGSWDVATGSLDRDFILSDGHLIMPATAKEIDAYIVTA
jgi:hypothetical protein